MKRILLVLLAVSFGCSEQHNSFPSPNGASTAPNSQGSYGDTEKVPERLKEKDSEKDKTKDKTSDKDTSRPSDLYNPYAPAAPNQFSNLAPTAVPNSATGPAPKQNNSQPDLLSPENFKKEDPTQKVDESPMPPGTPASNAAEQAAFSSTPKSGVQPEGSSLLYTSADEPRIKIYKLFLAGTLTPGDVVKLLFKDRDFNRAVLVVGDLYHQDKLKGAISPDADVKFQELGQKLGNAVVLYNDNNKAKHYMTLTQAVLAGIVVGAVAGKFFLDEDMIPEIMQTKMERIPDYMRDMIIGGVAGGAISLVSVEAVHIIYMFMKPGTIYNADPLLDMPSH